MDLDEALSNRNMIRAKLEESISDDISDWGITLKTVEIQDINPSKTMQTAMEEQAAAERKRRATVTTAEGDKSAAILQAEGRLTYRPKLRLFQHIKVGHFVSNYDRSELISTPTPLAFRKSRQSLG